MPRQALLYTLCLLFVSYRPRGQTVVSENAQVLREDVSVVRFRPWPPFKECESPKTKVTFWLPSRPGSREPWTKTEQNRVLAWRLKLLQQASAIPRNVAQACRHFGV